MRLSLIAVVLLMALPVFAQTTTPGGARLEGGRLILEEITILGELRTPQALFLMLKSTPNLSNVLLDRSFLEDVVRPIYPGAFATEANFMVDGSRGQPLPKWVRYGSVAVLGGLSAYSYASDNSESGLIFGVMAGMDLLGNLLYDFIGQ
ncbi:MAG: hypothetical protein R6V62_10370 [Candidatus Fermentibacteraceae bacterium]